ncbi:MAG: YciI family protein [Lapillicoccus sp.]
MSDATPTRTWYVLLHTRGPAVEAGQSVFEHPGISEHYAFLQRRVAAGELVAAGPLPDEPGSGMTVLAIADLDTATRMATQDDQAVVQGVLRVQVRPWQVVMAKSDGE